MELFAYVHMGGKIENIELVLVLREGREEEDRRCIERAIETFDARQCSCFSDSDKARMLTVIDTAFGSMTGFNEAVRPIMRGAGSALLSPGDTSLVEHNH